MVAGGGGSTSQKYMPSLHLSALFCIWLRKSSTNNLSANVDKFFSEYYPSQYLSHYMVYHTTKIQKLIDMVEEEYKVERCWFNLDLAFLFLRTSCSRTFRIVAITVKGSNVCVKGGEHVTLTPDCPLFKDTAEISLECTPSRDNTPVHLNFPTGPP
ncbi:hypothetical protein M8C21_019520 [Ambrosia artemisiifolia]|uniref:Uncharacterized protein n=1 Tax=Ambrosia artemisiifolia TaxID=4212 RepID=A0AAD5G403_AMBAR|nr:hypothetical protein M8C21_019520 [Ambrosia artemisiifolia]